MNFNSIVFLDLGFLGQYIRGKPIHECVDCGIWAASEVIQQQGCTFPKDKKYER